MVNKLIQWATRKVHNKWEGHMKFKERLRRWLFNVDIVFGPVGCWNIGKKKKKKFCEGCNARINCEGAELKTKGCEERQHVGKCVESRQWVWIVAYTVY